MKPRRGVFHGNGPDILGQISPQGSQHLPGGQVPDRAERGALTQGVHARVSPPASVNLQILAEGPRQHGLHLALNGHIRIRQPLPSPVAAAVVLQDQFIIRHDYLYTL